MITEPIGGVVVPVKPGEMRKATLTFRAPSDLRPKSKHVIRIFQRNDRRIITGGVFLAIEVMPGKGAEAPQDEDQPPPRPRRRSTRRRTR